MQVKAWSDSASWWPNYFRFLESMDMQPIFSCALPTGLQKRQSSNPCVSSRQLTNIWCSNNSESFLTTWLLLVRHTRRWARGTSGTTHLTASRSCTHSIKRVKAGTLFNTSSTVHWAKTARLLTAILSSLFSSSEISSFWLTNLMISRNSATAWMPLLKPTRSSSRIKSKR